MRGKQIRMQHVREVLRLKAAGSSNRQISTLRRSRSFVDWNKIGSLAKTIDGLRTSIAGPLAAAAPPSSGGALFQLFCAGPANHRSR